MKIVEMNNEIIKSKIYSNLKKQFSEQLTEEELKKVKSITLNSKDSNQNRINYNEYDYKCLENLEAITLNGFIIDDEMITNLNYLKNLKTIIFNHCTFKNEKTINNELENLLITYSKLERFNLFKNVEKIKAVELIEVGEIDIKDITNIENIIELSIYNSKIKNSIMINDFINLKKLKLHGSLVDEEKFSELLNKSIEFSYKEKYFLES